MKQPLPTSLSPPAGSHRSLSGLWTHLFWVFRLQGILRLRLPWPLGGSSPKQLPMWSPQAGNCPPHKGPQSLPYPDRPHEVWRRETGLLLETEAHCGSEDIQNPFGNRRRD